MIRPFIFCLLPMTACAALAQIGPIFAVSAGYGDAHAEDVFFEEDFDLKFLAGTVGIAGPHAALTLNHVNMENEGDLLSFDNKITSLAFSWDWGSRENAYTGGLVGIGRQELGETDFNTLHFGVHHTRMLGETWGISAGGEYAVLRETDDNDDNPDGSSLRLFAETGVRLGKTALRFGVSWYGIDFETDFDYAGKQAYVKWVTAF